MDLLRITEGEGMTWSILAKDSANGALGIAVTTEFFGVGGICPFVESGVGAVAHQARSARSNRRVDECLGRRRPSRRRRR